MYASTKAFEAIQEAMEAMEDLLRDYFNRKSDCREQSETCVAKLQSAVTELAKEARAHLGFEPLAEGLVETKERFLHYISAPERPMPEGMSSLERRAPTT